MKYEVYYNMMGVMPVRNFFETKESAEAFKLRAEAKGFKCTLKEM